jgi:EpsI family protein
VEELKFDDYILANYVDQSQQPVNLYAAYYASQRADKLPHSPKACLPGGGWKVGSFDQHIVNGVTVNGQPLSVNRAIMEHGELKQLVYYWFQQRGRVITSEYHVKWYLFLDALTRNRSDGSLVRLVAPIKPGQSVEEVDQKLASFAKAMNGY